MKALIIDDEPPVIMVVRMLVDWEAFGIDTVFTSQSAEQALEVLDKEKPEIILSDVNLPGLSGLELVEKLRNNGSTAQVIFISAYDKFSYAKKAMQLDSVDYLLKPIDRESVNNAVEKAVGKCREMTGHLDDYGRQEAERLFSAFMGTVGTIPDMDSFSRLCAVAPWLDLGSWRVCVVSMQHLKKENLSRYSLQGMISDHLYRNKLGVSSTWGNTAETVMLLGGSRDAETDKAVCRRILTDIYEGTGLILHAGMSEPFSAPGGVSEAYRKALGAAVSCNLILDAVSVEDASFDQRSNLPPITSLMWLDKVLFPALEERSGERARHAVKELGRHLEKGGVVTIRQLENFRAMYNSQRSKWILACQKEQGMMLRIPDIFQESYCLDNGQFTAGHFCEVLDMDLAMLQERYLPAAGSVSTAELCLRAKRIMEEHFSEEVSLEELSRKLGISQGHLSRSFKKETGMSPIDYLTQYRISQACRMLDEGMRIVDVASAVGLADPKYFSRVFRKVKGLSPSEYRGGTP
jgi:two-component system response regulator YesN